MESTQKHPSLLQALIPVIFLILLLGTNVFIFGDYSLDGSNQISLILAACVAGIVSLRLGVKWDHVMKSAVRSISSAMESILILLAIGALAGTWLLSGIVPTLIYYGLQILNPTIFLFAACIISAVVSLATGSSWTTIATIGVALLGIGQALEIDTGLIGGAIISGAYFGDKMSPLSDTTNLAPAMAGTDLFTHIRYMMYTTIPSMVITLIIFLIIGFTMDSSVGSEGGANLEKAILEAFNITPLLFVVPIIIIVLIVKKMPAFPAILIGSLLGGFAALIFQPELVQQVGNEALREVNSSMSDTEYTAWKDMQPASLFSFASFMKSMYGDISIVTSDSNVNDLLSTSGMSGMLKTVWLIVCAMIFGGMMEAGNLLQRIAATIIQFAHSTGSLIASTVGTCIFFNVTASDQYMAIVVPGRMYSKTFKERGLAPEVLSRSLEDSGTVTSVLVPWNTCGATQSAVLGIATLTYAPYCFFNIISPFMTMIFGYANIKIRKVPQPVKED